MWIDVIKAYDCEILYHPGKDNVVSDALSRKASSTPVRELCLRMTIDSPLLDLIREVQIEGSRRENWKNEKIKDQIDRFSTNNRGLMTHCGRVWVPIFGGVR